MFLIILPGPRTTLRRCWYITVRYKTVQLQNGTITKRCVVQTAHYYKVRLQNGTPVQNGTLLQNSTLQNSALSWRYSIIRDWLGVEPNLTWLWMWSCLALCLDCVYGEYWFRLSRLSMMVIGSFASYTKTKSVESAVWCLLTRDDDVENRYLNG